MMLKKVNLSQLSSRLTSNRNILTSHRTIISTQHLIKNYVLHQNKSFGYRFSTIRDVKTPMSDTKITFEIQKATSAQQLRSILSAYSKMINFIHRTVLLQKVTQRPFDQDEELLQQVISEIKINWKHDYCEPTQANSRAIANTICYMSRKRKLHHLDQEFTQIDFYQLARHLNPKEFVMTLNGLLKLELTDKVETTITQKFSIQKFIRQNIDEKFFPSLLVSMWFNVLKYQKSSENINNFFSQLLKNKHFKTNLIDYMQIVFCYVNSEGQRTIDLTYPVMTHPKQLNPKTFMGAHELSVLYEQLAKLKKIKDIYFSEEFTELLETCFLRILNERDVPLRNLANVLNYMVQYENPTSKTLQATFHKYFTVIKAQIATLQRAPQNKKPRTNVDPLSFVTIFNHLLEYYQPSNNYLNQMVSISMTYIERIITNQSMIYEYNERTFMRLLSGIDLGKKMIEEKYPGRTLSLSSSAKFGFQKEIIRRSFGEVQHLAKLINFVYTHQIRCKEVCYKLKKLVQSVPKENEAYSASQQKLTQKCILNKNCRNCANCFSN